jgi:threonine/homoserine/homoserine lactone efflux protein
VRWAALIGFGLAVLPICLTPGVSFTLVTQRVLARGPRGGVRVAMGTSAGLVCHATLAGLGLSALVMRSSQAFTVIKLLGGLYLVVLGISTIRRSRGREDEPARQLPWSGHGDVTQAFLGNVLNPKAAAVYLTLAPQFIDQHRPVLPQMLALVAVHIVVAVTWLLTWTGVTTGLRGTVATPRFRRVMDRVTGSVLVGLGVRTAAAR